MRVPLADDQTKVRSALRLLPMHEPEVEIMGEVANSTVLLGWVKVVCPDLILLDWELPGLPGATLLSLLYDHCPRLQVIALSGRPEARKAALDAVADAFASKGDPPERLLAAMNAC